MFATEHEKMWTYYLENLMNKANKSVKDLGVAGTSCCERAANLQIVAETLVCQHVIPCPLLCLESETEMYEKMIDPGGLDSHVSNREVSQAAVNPYSFTGCSTGGLVNVKVVASKAQGDFRKCCHNNRPHLAVVLVSPKYKMHP